MARLAPLLAVALIAAACGSSSAKNTQPTVPPKPGPGRVIYQGSAWAVVLANGKATAEHLVGDEWRPDRSGRVKVTILGPKPGSTGNPRQGQFAASMSANGALVESQIWVDGEVLLVKGGGLKPNSGTIYGTTAGPLTRGKHTAIAYARTATHATAVAWTFSV